MTLALNSLNFQQAVPGAPRFGVLIHPSTHDKCEGDSPSMGTADFHLHVDATYYLAPCNSYRQKIYFLMAGVYNVTNAPKINNFFFPAQFVYFQSL